TPNIRIGYFTVAKTSAKVLAVRDNGIIGDLGYDTALAIVETLHQLMKDYQIDYVHMACLHQDSKLREALRLVYPRRIVEDPIDRRWMLKLPTTFDDFLKNLSPNIRRNIRWRRNKFNKAFPDAQLNKITPIYDKDHLDITDVQAVYNKTYQSKLGLSQLNNLTWKLLKDFSKLVCVILKVNDDPIAFG
ncbi:MAG: peptidogalycan biosysnthesis protein, partial [Candidatus Hadarchaeum sp.]